MKIFIVSGMSGAGKTKTVGVLEDLGFYCVDNVQPGMFIKFAEFSLESRSDIKKLVLVSDARSKNFFDDFLDELKAIKQAGYDYRILFLDAKDEVLYSRYKETRRKHPFIERSNGSIEKAIAKERKGFINIKAEADFVIDTSNLTLAELKENVEEAVLGAKVGELAIDFVSFGFKYGQLQTADIIFDVRCLQNPFYVTDLKYKTGLDHEVYDYVLSFEESQQFLEKIIDFIIFSLPLYKREGKNRLVVGIGCTGGKHRSVTFARRLGEIFTEKGENVSVNHREIISEKI